MVHHRKTPIADPPLCQQILLAPRFYINFYFFKGVNGGILNICMQGIIESLLLHQGSVESRN